MFSYAAYGLTINSYLPLPELLKYDAEADVIIRQGKVTHPPDAQISEDCIWATATEAIFFWDDIGTIWVRNGQEVVIDAIANVHLDVLRLFLLGSALGTLLHQRGKLVLHGSVIAIQGQAIAFLGESGWGKSTTVAALCQNGHQMVTDDITVIDFDGRGYPIVFPSFPQVKLWDDAVIALGDIPAHLPKIRPELEKYAKTFQQDFSVQPLPLRQLYILGGGQRLEIERVELQTAFTELIFHSYASPFLTKFFSNPQHFGQCARLINAISINRLKRPCSLQKLGEIVELVENDFAACC